MVREFYKVRARLRDSSVIEGLDTRRSLFINKGIDPRTVLCNISEVPETVYNHHSQGLSKVLNTRLSNILCNSEGSDTRNVLCDSEGSDTRNVLCDSEGSDTRNVLCDSEGSNTRNVLCNSEGSDTRNVLFNPLAPDTH